MTCPQCRQESPSGSRFFNGCGARPGSACHASGHANPPAVAIWPSRSADRIVERRAFIDLIGIGLLRLPEAQQPGAGVKSLRRSYHDRLLALVGT